MLTKISKTDIPLPKISKKVNEKNCDTQNAFSYGSIVNFTVEVPRRLGASAVVLRFFEDGGKYTDHPLEFSDTALGTDTYSIDIDTKLLCGKEKDGLFYYELLFLRGYDTLFSNTYNYVDFTLETESAGKFIFLIYQREFDTPKWFQGKIMYHIFVDRFCKGDRKLPCREDAVINEDWENGVPQFAKKNGDSLSNNMFFGGNLWGIIDKLDYLKSLGVGVIYLSPIFEAYSNHKYDTGNYFKIDEMFGGEEAFVQLIDKAEQKGIKIILDGVFNHTGDDSLYFDRYGKYGNIGAYSDPNSFFRNWFKFRTYPEEYETWWGIRILPKLNHMCEECRNYFVGVGGVAEKYINMGIGGWRLDVADELPDSFLDEFRLSVKKASGGDGIVIGEVWENAAEKIAYGARRRYFRGDQLDSVMNYPLRNGILSFLLYGDAEFLADTLKSVYASYPKCVCDCLMNLLGTHDTERILTVLGENCPDGSDEENEILATKRMDKEHLSVAVRLLKLAATIQYTVYGVPSVFYGDEAGLQGYHDPFCRMPFPWGRENTEILEHYRTLGKIRNENDIFADGDFKVEYSLDKMIVYSRQKCENKVVVIVNANDIPQKFDLNGKYIDLFSGEEYFGKIDEYSSLILKQEEK